MFRELRIQPISAKYNGASVHLTAYGRERLDAQLSVTNFSLDPFTAPSAQGWTFWYWCRKLSSASAERPARPDVPTTFVPVQVTDAPPTAAVAIVLVDGTQIQVHAGASAALVQAVVAAVRAAC
jgi:hypothetical protein